MTETVIPSNAPASAAWLPGRLHLVGLLAVAGATACSDPPTIARQAGSPTRDHMLALVTPAVAGKLDPNGHFELSAGTGNSQFPEVTAEGARQLASTWVGEFGPRVHRYLEQVHGGSIDFHSLAPCGRTFYARSAFASVPSGVPMPYVLPYGPWYLTTFCASDGAPSVSVAVSAWSTDLSVVHRPNPVPFLCWERILPDGHSRRPRWRVSRFAGNRGNNSCATNRARSRCCSGAGNAGQFGGSSSGCEMACHAGRTRHS